VSRGLFFFWGVFPEGSEAVMVVVSQRSVGITAERITGFSSLRPADGLSPPHTAG
jgi:hypothetical protein